jgi:hypothetical protein
MTDRPIIFSAPMVRALLAGRKTQTRRLATSPLRRVKVGDRLYVRESMYLWSASHDAEVTFAADDVRFQTGPNTGDIPDVSLAAYFRMVDQSRDRGKRISRPSIHMPRWASRLTLIVEGVTFQPLRVIAEADAVAEGVTPISFSSGPNFFSVDVGFGSLNAPTAAETFGMLWRQLHAEGSWDANPNVVALTFRVVRGNIDRISSGEVAA